MSAPTVDSTFADWAGILRALRALRILQNRGLNPTIAQIEREAEELRRAEAYTAGKVKAGKASALAKARRRAYPAPGVVDLVAWRKLRGQ